MLVTFINNNWKQRSQSIRNLMFLFYLLYHIDSTLSTLLLKHLHILSTLSLEIPLTLYFVLSFIIPLSQLYFSLCFHLPPFCFSLPPLYSTFLINFLLNFQSSRTLLWHSTFSLPSHFTFSSKFSPFSHTTASLSFLTSLSIYFLSSLSSHIINSLSYFTFLSIFFS